MHSTDNGSAIAVALTMYFMFAFYGAMMIVMVGLVVIWIMALVDVVKREFKEPNDKLIWVLVVCLAGWLGGLIYMGVGRQKGWLPEQPHLPPPGGPPPPNPSL